MTTAIPITALAASSRSAPPDLRPIVSPLAPVISGARARGVADALDWLGLAAVLFDEQGDILHVNDAARCRLGVDFRVDFGRMRGVDAELDESLQAAIREAVSGGRTRLAIPARNGTPRTTLRIESIDCGADDPFQLLKAIAIFENEGQSPIYPHAQAN